MLVDCIITFKVSRFLQREGAQKVSGLVCAVAVSEQ